MDLYGGKGRDIWYPGGQTYELHAGHRLTAATRSGAGLKDGLDG